MNAPLSAVLQVVSSGPARSATTLASGAPAALLAGFRVLLAESFALQSRGASAAELGYARGRVDGFARCLLESGALGERELLALVQEARRGHSGPATGSLHADGSSARPLR
jgi:hypothetical protein